MIYTPVRRLTFLYFLCLSRFRFLFGALSSEYIITNITAPDILSELPQNVIIPGHTLFFWTGSVYCIHVPDYVYEQRRGPPKYGLLGSEEIKRNKCTRYPPMILLIISFQIQWKRITFHAVDIPFLLISRLHFHKKFVSLTAYGSNLHTVSGFPIRGQAGVTKSFNCRCHLAWLWQMCCRIEFSSVTRAKWEIMTRSRWTANGCFEYFQSPDVCLFFGRLWDCRLSAIWAAIYIHTGQPIRLTFFSPSYSLELIFFTRALRFPVHSFNQTQCEHQL